MHPHFAMLEHATAQVAGQPWRAHFRSLTLSVITMRTYGASMRLSLGRSCAKLRHRVGVFVTLSGSGSEFSALVLRHVHRMGCGDRLCRHLSRCRGNCSWGRRCGYRVSHAITAPTELGADQKTAAKYGAWATALATISQ